MFPDHFVHVRGVGLAAGPSSGSSTDLRPGVTEVYVHPAVDTPELRALAPDWAGRVDDHDLVTHDRALRAMLDRAGVELIGYRALRDLQRAALTCGCAAARLGGGRARRHAGAAPEPASTRSPARPPPSRPAAPSTFTRTTRSPSTRTGSTPPSSRCEAGDVVLLVNEGDGPPLLHGRGALRHRPPAARRGDDARAHRARRDPLPRPRAPDHEAALTVVAASTAASPADQARSRPPASPAARGARRSAGAA